MTSIVELNVSAEKAQRFVQELGGTSYNFRLTYNTESDGSWILDIGDSNQVPIVAGIPLVSGTDLLGAYRHLGFTGSLVVTTDRGSGEVPTFEGLGTTSHVFFVPD